MLTKQGSKWPYNWSKRYCKLSGNQFAFYKKEKDPTAVGQIYLKNATVTVVPKEISGKDYCIKIDISQQQESKVKCVMLQATALKDMEDWVGMLQKGVLFANHIHGKVSALNLSKLNPFENAIRNREKESNGGVTPRKFFTFGKRSSVSMSHTSEHQVSASMGRESILSSSQQGSIPFSLSNGNYLATETDNFDNDNDDDKDE